MYTLSAPVVETPRFNGDTIQCGTHYDVLRDGVEVARIYTHPSRYRGGLASVSMTKIAWAGDRPQDARDGAYPKNMDHALFFDFVSKYQTVELTLPEVISRVEAIRKWRAARAG